MCSSRKTLILTQYVSTVSIPRADSALTSSGPQAPTRPLGRPIFHDSRHSTYILRISGIKFVDRQDSQAPNEEGLVTPGLVLNAMEPSQSSSKPPSRSARSPPEPYPPIPSPARALSLPRQQSAMVYWRSLGRESSGLSPKVCITLHSYHRIDDPAAPAVLLCVHLCAWHEHRHRQHVGPTRSRAQSYLCSCTNFLASP